MTAIRRESNRQTGRQADRQTERQKGRDCQCSGVKLQMTSKQGTDLWPDVSDSL